MTRCLVTNTYFKISQQYNLNIVVAKLLKNCNDLFTVMKNKCFIVTKKMSGNSEFLIILYNLYHLQGIFILYGFLTFLKI